VLIRPLDDMSWLPVHASTAHALPRDVQLCVFHRCIPIAESENITVFGGGAGRRLTCVLLSKISPGATTSGCALMMCVKSHAMVWVKSSTRRYRSRYAANHDDIPAVNGQ